MKASTYTWSTIVIAVAALAVLAVVSDVSVSDVRNLGTPRNAIVDQDVQTRVPLPEGPAERLAPVVPVTTSGEYRFTFVDDGEPVRYDPCRPILWVHNTDGMPAGAEPLVHRAVEEIERTTGLVFHYQGESDMPASFDRPLFIDEGARFTPTVIGWSTASQFPELAGSVAGIGGSTAVTGAFGDQRYLVGGVVVMDSETIAEILGAAGGSDLVTAVIMHEFAHVVGLDHVSDPRELMHETNMSLTEWGPGDLAGLATAGAGPCQDA